MINDFLDNQRKVALLKFTKKDWLKQKEMIKNEYFHNGKK